MPCQLNEFSSAWGEWGGVWYGLMKVVKHAETTEGLRLTDLHRQAAVLVKTCRTEPSLMVSVPPVSLVPRQV